MGVTVDLHLLAGLAHRLEKGLFRIHSTDINIAVGQGRGRRAAAGIGDHHVVGTMGGACADAGRSAAGTGSST